MSLMVGVDVGGTSTDTVVFDSSTGSVRIGKVPTTPGNQAHGILASLKMLSASPEKIETLVHGTTVATNAVIEGGGSRCGLIATRGFRDLIELGRRTRPSTYGLTGTFAPLIDRVDRVEVSERTEAGGLVALPLDEEELCREIRRLRERGVESLVIHFLHAYETPLHEQRAAEIARQEWGNPYVTAAAELLPLIREFERLMTAVVNAYVQPLIHRYVSDLQHRLSAEGFSGTFAITQSSGGAVDSELSWRQAVRTVLSGPAAGVAAAAEIARAAGFPSIVACDMGGTSFDVSLIVDGMPLTTSEKELRYKVPISLPMIDIETIGAGGGSIAAVDAAGMLAVGPRSAGAVPGPVCYGKGGTEPTVTDANVMLGRLDMAVLPRGGEGAPFEEAIRRHVADPLGLTPLAAAAGIVRLANSKMATAVRTATIERGHDPRDFALVAYGGAGPLHAVEIAREIGIPTVVVPLLPGLTCAYGCLLGEIRHDFVRTVNMPLASSDPAELAAILRDQERRGLELIAAESGAEHSQTHYEADLQYDGQTHVLTLPLQGPEIDPAALYAAFGAAFRQRFTVEFEGTPCRLVNLRTAVVGGRPKLDLEHLYQSVSGVTWRAPRSRPVHFSDGWADCQVIDRFALRSDEQLAGPAIVEQTDTTTLIPPGAAARVDAFGNLIIDCGRWP